MIPTNELTNPEAVLYRGQGITKGALAEYYLKIAGWLLPYVEKRPLTLLRCPDGQHEQCFVQKHARPDLPEAIVRLAIRDRSGRTLRYMGAEDPKALLALVQIGALELHAWLARADTPDRPDRLLFDFDAGEDVEFRDVVRAARELHDRMHAVGLDSFVQTTGGDGLHVFVPIERRSDWEAVSEFTAAVAARMSADSPERYTTAPSAAQSRSRVTINVSRNVRGGSSICPYSTRARARATVATPLEWPELHDDLRPASFTVLTVPERLARLDRDPWEDFLEVRQAITLRARRAMRV